MADEKLKELMKNGWSWRAYGSGLTTSEEDALRDKADAVTGESSATLAGAVDALIAGFGAGGGGSSAIYSGSFTPAENVLTATIDVGNSFNRLLLVPEAEIADIGIGAKTFFLYYYDGTRAVKLHTFVYSGNAGFTGSSATPYTAFDFAVGYSPTIEGTKITFKNGTSGATLGYFVAGVTYRWIAW